MKTKYYILTGLSLALAACSNDDVVQTSGSDEIKLSVVTSTLSRASNLFSSSSQLDKFTLNAYVADKKTSSDGVESYPIYIKNDVVTLQGGAWTMSDTYLWPAFDALNFYALHDNTSAYTRTTTMVAAVDDADNTFNGKSAVKVTGFQMQPASDQDDVLYAVALGKTAANTKDTDGTVQLNFRHALAAINFVIQNSSSYLYVEVKDISICGAYTKGDLYYGGDTETSTQFKNDDGTNAYAYSTDCYWDKDETSAGDIAVYSNATAFDALLPESGKLDLSNSKENTALEIPQVYSSGAYDYVNTKWTGVYAKISCRIYNIVDPTKLDGTQTHDDIVGNSTTAGLGVSVFSNNDNWKTLYVPLSEITEASSSSSSGSGEVDGGVSSEIGGGGIIGPGGGLGTSVGWKAGNKYVYTLTFTDGGGDNARNEDGTRSLISITVKVTNDVWSDSELSLEAEDESDDSSEDEG